MVAPNDAIVMPKSVTLKRSIVTKTIIASPNARESVTAIDLFTFGFLILNIST